MFNRGLAMSLIGAAALAVYSPRHDFEPVNMPLGGFSGSRRSKGKNVRRGKGKVSKPRKRPNRLTISKRVRRKHRRAA